jgi:hypothetical protein
MQSYFTPVCPAAPLPMGPAVGKMRIITIATAFDAYSPFVAVGEM